MTKKVMKLVDGHTGRMICRVCGSEHYASIKSQSDGRYYRGSWQCQYGCKPEDAKKGPTNESTGERESAPVSN